ncbi:MAG: PilZ domain-containing protein [Deltaproteobacteria bacterium]|nr:MAG: PilZ domain-containing protein [Deltaproteobacteria bacterium]
MYKPLFKDDRKNERVTVRLVAAETTGGRYFLPMVTDLSTDGACLACPSGLEKPRAHFVVLELMLPGCNEIVWARCRIVHEKVEGFFRRQGLQFINISAHHRMLLTRYLQRCTGKA